MAVKFTTIPSQYRKCLGTGLESCSPLSNSLPGGAFRFTPFLLFPFSFPFFTCDWRCMSHGMIIVIAPRQPSPLHSHFSSISLLCRSWFESVLNIRRIECLWCTATLLSDGPHFILCFSSDHLLSVPCGLQLLEKLVYFLSYSGL